MRRLLPAAGALIEADDLPKLQKLAELVWLNASLVEDSLEMASRIFEMCL